MPRGIDLNHPVHVPEKPALEGLEPKWMQSWEETGVYRFEAPGSYPVPDATDLGPPPAGMSAHANAAWMSRHLWQLSYESAQTPFFIDILGTVQRSQKEPFRRDRQPFHHIPEGVMTFERAPGKNRVPCRGVRRDLSGS